MEVGTHCNNPTCNRLDFLPIKCQYCKKTFCSDHFQLSNHDCPHKSSLDSSQIPTCPICKKQVPFLDKHRSPDEAISACIDSGCKSPKKEKKFDPHKCCKKGCKKKELVPIKCGDCQQNFCIAHRTADSHNCKGKMKADDLLRQKRIQKYSKPVSNSQQTQEQSDHQLALQLQRQWNEDFYYGWSRGPYMYNPPKFPKKPRVTTLNAQVGKKESSQWGYAPAHAYLPPWEKMEKFKDVNLEMVVPDLTEREKEIFDFASSYQVASKQEKQRDTHFKVLKHVQKNMPNLTAYDLKKDGLIRKIIFITCEIRNFQEDLHELYSIRRYENQRNITKKYQAKRSDIIIMLEERCCLLAKLRSIHFENYCLLMKALNLENIEPARKPLPYPNHLQQKENLEKHQDIGRSGKDGRMKRGSHYLSPYSAHFMDQNNYHRQNDPNRHTAAVIDMRIRTFYEMEQQEQRAKELNAELDKKTKENMVKILENYHEIAKSQPEAAVWKEFLEKKLIELKK